MAIRVKMVKPNTEGRQQHNGTNSALQSFWHTADDKCAQDIILKIGWQEPRGSQDPPCRIKAGPLPELKRDCCMSLFLAKVPFLRNSTTGASSSTLHKRQDLVLKEHMRAKEQRGKLRTLGGKDMGGKISHSLHLLCQHKVRWLFHSPSFELQGHSSPFLP